VSSRRLRVGWDCRKRIRHRRS